MVGGREQKEGKEESGRNESQHRTQKKGEEEERKENMDPLDHVTTKRAISRRQGGRGGGGGGGGGGGEEESWGGGAGGKAWEALATGCRSRVVRDRDRKKIVRWWKAWEVITRCGRVAVKGVGGGEGAGAGAVGR